MLKLPKASIFYLLFLGLLLMSFVSTTSAKEQLDLETLVNMTGIIEQIKIPLDATDLASVSAKLQLRVFENDEPVNVSNIDYSLQSYPDSTSTLGEMILYQRAGEQISLLAIMQNINLRGEDILVLYYGLLAEGDDSERFSRTSTILDIPQLDDSSLLIRKWGVSEIYKMDDGFMPLYVWAGLTDDGGVIRFFSYQKDDIQIQTQLHNVLIVLGFQIN